MPSCILRVSGKKYDPIPDLEKTELAPHPYKAWCSGDKVHPNSSIKRKYEYGGFSCEAADTKSEKLSKQIKKTIKFLKNNESNLKSLFSNTAIEQKTLDFQINLRINKKTWGQFDRFPPELLFLAGKLGIGIEISLYKS